MDSSFYFHFYLQLWFFLEAFLMMFHEAEKNTDKPFIYHPHCTEFVIDG